MTAPVRLFLSAGEVSGDVYGAALARAILEARPDVCLMGLGGERMAQAGVELLADVTQVAAVGVLEQLPALGPVAGAFREAARHLERWRPDAVVTIDFQGANLRLASIARRLGIRTVYYILPQAWLWGLPGDARRVTARVDRLIAVLEPEAVAYAAAGGHVTRVGHPLLDLVPAPTSEAATPTVALLPGSRRQELRHLVPAFLGAAERLLAGHPNARFVVPAASEELASKLRRALSASQLPISLRPAGDWGDANVALVASGTAVLEAAVRDVPCVAAYRVSKLTAWLARRLLAGPHVTLPNILLGQPLVPECLQQAANPSRLADEVDALLRSPSLRASQREGFARVRDALGGPGGVAAAAAVVLEEADRGRAGSLPPQAPTR